MGDTPAIVVCGSFKVSRSSVYEARTAAMQPARLTRQALRLSAVSTSTIVTAIRTLVEAQQA